jgi:hypothetical protein
MRHVKTKIATAIAASFLILFVRPSVRAQDVPPETRSDISCNSLPNNRALGLWTNPSRVPRIVTSFIGAPSADAGTTQIKRHILYSNIFGLFVSKRSSGQCFLWYAMDSSLVPSFEISRAGSGGPNACFQQRCTQSLSQLLDSMVLDRQAFTGLIDGLVRDIRSSDSINLSSPALSMMHAAGEAFRHIYPPGTREHILLSLSAEDYLAVQFDEFSAWLTEKQNAFRSIRDGKEPPVNSSDNEPPLAEAKTCLPGLNIPIEMVDIDHHGWGHRSLIMIKSAFRGDGLFGIENAGLRAFCPPGEQSDVLKTFPWRDMIGRISCSRRRMSDQERWLTLFSKQEPSATVTDMARHAHGIAETLTAERCVDPGLRILVINFLLQR